MKRFRYRYESTLCFQTPASAHSWLQRCLPRDEQFQRTEQFCISVNARGLHGVFAVPAQVGHDGLGNPLVFGHVQAAHTGFHIVSEGVVCQSPYRICGTVHGMFLEPTTLTHSSPVMVDFAREVATHLGSSADDPRQLACALSAAVHDYMTYAPGSTTVATGADLAFERRKGVCQDYAHIVIALLRCLLIPARYSCGFLSGEGATHAWVEFFEHGVWLGLDPTNDRLLDCGCIKIAHGRDSADCAVNRGVFTGGLGQQNFVSIKVEEL